MIMAQQTCRQHLTMAQALGVAVRTREEGPALAMEEVNHADLADAIAETWRDECLRRGYPELGWSEVPMRLEPRFSQGKNHPRCAGFDITVDLPDGRRLSHPFSISCLNRVASRMAERLIAAGRLGLGQRYYYEVLVADRAPSTAGPVPEAPFSLSVRSCQPACARVDLLPLLEQARPVGAPDGEAFHVFITAEALARAEACSRRGAKSAPPVESGGVLVGSPAYCERTREFFAIISDVLEVSDAEQTQFSLAYTGRSWSRIQAIMKTRRQARPERAERLMGQCHGHNFLPEAANACDRCEKRGACGLTSVFVSREDQTWMSAVFHRQPWALCQIFGLSARREPVDQLYSLKDARWQPRGYHLLPEFTWNREHSGASATGQPDEPALQSATNTPR
jgi:hypothetical protein